MIPYFAPELHFGSTTIAPFGLMVGIGISLAMFIFDREAKRRCLYPKPLMDLTTWGLVGGALGAHWMELFLYHPEDLVERGPLQILKFWDGLASTGGMIGGLIAGLIFLRRRGLPFAAYADVLALGVTPGWALARVGCFLVHDHPGRRTNFFLAVRFPYGTRHDLGLEEAILLFGMTALVFFVARRGWLTNRLLPLMALVYGPARFCLDFLRSTDLPGSDARYLGLTPAQYVCFAMVAWGVWRMVKPMRNYLPASELSTI